MKKWMSVLLVFFVFACDEKDEPGTGRHYFVPDYPDHFPVQIVPADNPTSREGVALGRRLYYDRMLSKGGPQDGRACADCHIQSNSFTSDNAVSVLPHINLSWNSAFLWNGKVEGTLEDIMRFEVSAFFRADTSLFQNSADYPALFEAAFGTPEVTRDRMARAMAQFQRTMISSNSKFDAFLEGKTQLNAAEQRGYDLFFSERGDCFHCHSIPLFTDNRFHNIGLVDQFKDHLGRYSVTKISSDVGAFKTPTLRNIALTSPYMHDDRFQTLTEVVEHYNSGVKKSPSLDPIMTKPGKETGLHLTSAEIADIVSFLHTLSDSSYLENPSLASPF